MAGREGVRTAGQTARMENDASTVLRAAADHLEALAARTTSGVWEPRGLLASRPEVIARFPDGATEHVAEARARTAEWITTLSPIVAAPLAAWLRAAAAGGAPGPEALAVARALAAPGLRPEGRRSRG